MVESIESGSKTYNYSTSEIFEANKNFVPREEQGTRRDVIPVEFINYQAEINWESSPTPKLGLEERIDLVEEYINLPRKLKVEKISYWAEQSESKVLISTKEVRGDRRYWMLLVKQQGVESTYVITQANRSSQRPRMEKVHYFPEGVMSEKPVQRTWFVRDDIPLYDSMSKQKWTELENHLNIFNKRGLLPNIKKSWTNTPLDF